MIGIANNHEVKSPPKVDGPFIQPTVVQPKLEIGEVDDHYEKEADRMADMVLHKKSIDADQPKPNEIVIQRKCSSCEEEERIRKKSLVDQVTPLVQKKESATSEGNVASEMVSTQINQAKGGGRPMNKETMHEMESGFGADFSSVRIHTGGYAESLSSELNAHAFTVGSDIFFNQGQYNPYSYSGKHLLAHELTHTVQQANSMNSIQRDSVLEEDAHITSRASGVVEGFVDRYEFDSQADFDNRMSNNRASAIHDSTVRLRFNSSNCTIEVPINIQIINQGPGITTTCGDINGRTADQNRPATQAQFNSAVQNIPQLTDRELNNLYSVHLGNPQAAGCQSEIVPINVVINNVTTNPDFTIVLTANSGRSYVTGNGRRMVLCGGDINNDSTIIHEMGHAVLGHGDEYHEDDGSRPESRERLGQYSRMAQDAPARLQDFHQHHFQFASAFMNSAFPGCNATMHRERASNVELSPNVGMGIIGSETGLAEYVELGLQLGIPLTEMRRLNLILATHTRLLLGLDGEFRNATALMQGFRFGLNYRNSFGNSSVLYSLSAFSEGGIGYNFGSSPFSILPAEDFFGYAEAGGRLGINVVDSTMTIGVEGAGGVLNLGDEDDPYFRLGANLAVNF